MKEKDLTALLGRSPTDKLLTKQYNLQRLLSEGGNLRNQIFDKGNIPSEETIRSLAAHLITFMDRKDSAHQILEALASSPHYMSVEGATEDTKLYVVPRPTTRAFLCYTVGPSDGELHLEYASPEGMKFTSCGDRHPGPHPFVEIRAPEEGELKLPQNFRFLSINFKRTYDDSLRQDSTIEIPYKHFVRMQEKAGQKVLQHAEV
tara:strand:+ start:73 stop:684 length:612 start_codon:yes stop_codon:yes gene_type:complete